MLHCDKPLGENVCEISCLDMGVDPHQEVFDSQYAGEVLPVASSHPGAEWDDYDPDTDDYDVRTAPCQPLEMANSEEHMVQLQMAALEKRIQNSGDLVVLNHYTCVLRELQQLKFCRGPAEQAVRNIDTEAGSGRWSVPMFRDVVWKDSCSSQLLSTTDGSSCLEDSEDSDAEVTLSNKIFRESACWSLQYFHLTPDKEYRRVRSDSCDSTDSNIRVWM